MSFFRLPKHKPAPSKYPHITKEFLQAERDAGKTVDQIAIENNMPRGSVSTLLTKYKVKRGKPT